MGRVGSSRAVSGCVWGEGEAPAEPRSTLRVRIGTCGSAGASPSLTIATLYAFRNRSKPSGFKEPQPDWPSRAACSRLALPSVRVYRFVMSLIHDIREKVAGDQFEFSKHAVDQAILRGMNVQEVREAVAAGVVIEDYPGDKYGSSCLLLGFTAAGRPLHVQCSYPSRPMIKIITLYEPDPDQWIDLRTRTRGVE